VVKVKRIAKRTGKNAQKEIGGTEIDKSLTRVNCLS
jgi:hypothetical protein